MPLTYYPPNFTQSDHIQKQLDEDRKLVEDSNELAREIMENNKAVFDRLVESKNLPVAKDLTQSYFQQIQQIKALINELVNFPIVLTSVIVNYFIDPSWEDDIQSNSSNNQLVEISSHESTLFSGKNTSTSHSEIQRSSNCYF